LGIIDQAIRDADKRNVRTRKAPVRATLHPDTAKVTEVVRSWHWSKGAGRTAEAAVQTSLLAYEDWYRRLSSVPLSDKRLSRFREWLISTLPVPAQAITQHFDSVLKRVGKRWKFDGNLVGWAWSETSPEVRGYGAELATEWCGEPELWDRLAEVVKGAE
jgi:hypothetical protein